MDCFGLVGLRLALGKCVKDPFDFKGNAGISSAQQQREAAELGIKMAKISLENTQREIEAIRRIRRERDELLAALKDIRWRINDVRDMLMSTGFAGNSIYGCDEWSVPTTNLQKAIALIDKDLAKVEGKGDE